MKLFINDWNSETYVMNTEENREYPINAWVAAGGDKQVFLVSAYVYHDFVMFFYMYDLDYHEESKECYKSEATDANEDSIEVLKRLNMSFSANFEYDINHLISSRRSGNICLPRKPIEFDLKMEQDEFYKLWYGEYDYLFNLMKDTERIPKELERKELAFKKDCISFQEVVDEISYLAVYPQTHTFHHYYVGKTFTVPYGACDITIPYTLTDTGEESFFIIKELKVQNMLESFYEQYDRLKEAHEKSLQEYENNKNKYSNQYEVISNDTAVSQVMDFEDIRRHYDVTILILSLLKPEEHRSFSFHIVNKINPVEISHSSNSASSSIWLFKPDQDDRMDGGLYKQILSIGEVTDKVKDEYEITLNSVTETYVMERKTLFERYIQVSKNC